MTLCSGIAADALWNVAPVEAAEATAGLIVGTVQAGDGTPLASARISAASASGRYSAVTDSHGRFTILGVSPDTYVLTAEAPGYASGVRSDVAVFPGQERRVAFRLETAIKTIGGARATSSAFVLGSPSDTYSVSGDAARAHFPTTSSSGLGSYTQGTVQGAIANVPGVDLDPFANAILRAGRVSDTVFDYDSIPIPQGLIAEPGGNVDGAQLPTTGIASTHVTLAGYSNESDNALGGIVDQIPAVGSYPGRSTFELAEGVPAKYQFAGATILGATPDLKWRYAFASTLGSEYFDYGDGHTFYPAEAATYGLSLQTRGQYSVETNVHYAATPKDDVSALILVGEAEYNQYDSPYSGETVGQFDDPPIAFYPGETNPNAPVHFASGVRGDYDIFKAQWQHTGPHLFTRLQIYQSQYGSSSAGPFWDENGFPDGSISLSETSSQRQNGVNLDNEAVFGRNRVRFGAEYRTNTSYLDQVVPTADEFITSNPTVGSYLAYAGDTWSASSRLELAGTARVTDSHFKPSHGSAYDTGAVDPHLGASYRLGSQYALRANFDHVTVAPAPLEADRIDSTNLDENGNPAPFVRLRPETANDFTYSFEGDGRTQFRLTYYQKFEQNLIDVLPFNFRSAVSSGLNPNGVGVPTNVGDLRANGFEVTLKNGGFSLDSNLVRAFSSSASQFAYNDLNAPAVAANHLFPVSYEPDFTTELSYEFKNANRRLRVTPSLSYSTGYPYGNGKMVYEFDPATNKPVRVPNDNYVNPGANYYFLQNPSAPFNAVTNPYIGNLGTNEGDDPNTLRSKPQMLVNLHLEGDITPRLTAIVDVANLFGNFAPTAYQNNSYLIGPPGYKGGNATYAACYAQILAGTVPCSPGLPAGTTPYTLGNGVPTNDGIKQSVPWSYGTGPYIAQSYPLGRTLQIRLRYRL
ncbi:MAG: TonB-dependent receptor [Candidatus Eremiobacteraeota bacterium]|nr:TonB-dependent receptor [Candidatus Eremiobacteraeota bacterium]